MNSAVVYIRPIVLTIKQAQVYAQIGRTRLFELVKAGSLDARRNNGKTVILTASLDAYLAALPKARECVEDADGAGLRLAIGRSDGSLEVLPAEAKEEDARAALAGRAAVGKSGLAGIVRVELRILEEVSERL